MQTRGRMLSFLFGVVLVAACGSKPKYPACDGDKDCAAHNEKCVNKQCVQCSADSDCPAGNSCQKNACTPIPGYCKTAADCKDGQVCENNACVACKSDNECAAGTKCQNGGCRGPGYCQSDADCPEDEDCQNNQCSKKAAPIAQVCSLEPVFFAFDKFELDDAAKALLKKNVDCINATKDKQLVLIGHADPRGTVEYNITLSDDRAQAVLVYLKNLGVSPDRMRKNPRGSSDSSGTDEASWAHDRRVEFAWQ
jgi:peptidoglycan-associated lipoprotein